MPPAQERFLFLHSMNRPLILALLTGALLGAAFPPSPFGALAFVAFVPLLLLWRDHAERLSRPKLFGLLYLTFFIYHGIANWWVSSWQDAADPYLFASGIALWIAHPVFLSLPWYILASVRRLWGRGAMLTLAPLLVAGCEWIHGQTDASYPWLSIGYDMIMSGPYAQLADIVGAYGLGFLILVTNVLIVAVITVWQNPAKRWQFMSALVALHVLWAGYGLVALGGSEDVVAESDPERLTVALVQPNIDPWDKWSSAGDQITIHRRLVDSARAGKKDWADVVIWSETAIPSTIRTPANRADYDELRRWIDTSGVALVTGFADLVTYEPGQAPPSARKSALDPALRYDAFNAAMVLQKGQTVVPVHHKTMLTPFAERLPFADQLTFAMSWVEWGVGISAWGKGRTRIPLPVTIRHGSTVSNIRLGMIVCIESIYPEVARDLVNEGADVLCVITNDAWFNGTPGPEQHFVISRMRAIEQRRWLLRCANSGMTGIIAPSGRPSVRIPAQTRAIAVGDAEPLSSRTVYAVVGDVVPIIGAVSALLAFLLTRFPRLLRKLPIHSNSNQG